MEHLAHAQQSRHLQEATEGLGDVDWIRAAGAVGQQHGAALALWRLVELRDRRALPSAWSWAVAIAIGLQLPRPEGVATTVLMHLCDSTCKLCRGRGYKRIAGTPHLSAEACPRCAGTGQRSPRWGKAGDVLHEALRQKQRAAAAALLRKLS